MTDHLKRIANLLNVTSTPMAGRLRYRLFEPPGARASVPRNYRYSVVHCVVSEVFPKQLRYCVTRNERESQTLAEEAVGEMKFGKRECPVDTGDKSCG
jgi:hypothetical protein